MQTPKKDSGDDSQDPIVIDYFDRINGKWVKVETTKEVARLLDEENPSSPKKQYSYSRKLSKFISNKINKKKEKIWNL